MARLNILSAVLLTAVTTMGDQQPYNLYKVSLTQIGYIQFLRYQATIPALHDFTLCIWLKSRNFNNSHPFFSYSKNEKERLVRSWLEPPSIGGKAHVKLHILEQEVMNVPVDINLGQWYHFCQSWSNSAGKWALHVDGKLSAAGDDWKTSDLVIPGGGDAVVGQEYTDFDKGLDDGIEGEVFGFNLLTSKPSVTRDSQILSWSKTRNNALIVPQPHYQVNSAKTPSWATFRYPQLLQTTLRGLPREKNLIRWPKDTVFSWKALRGNPGSSNIKWPQDRTSETRDADVDLDPGLELVKKSYSHCAARRGSPVDESRLLIAWARTPVRVFGGAIITTARPVCGDF